MDQAQGLANHHLQLLETLERQVSCDGAEAATSRGVGYPGPTKILQAVAGKIHYCSRFLSGGTLEKLSEKIEDPSNTRSFFVVAKIWI